MTSPRGSPIYLAGLRPTSGVIRFGADCLRGSAAERDRWGNKPHRSQPIAAELDFAKTALERAHSAQQDCRFVLITHDCPGCKPEGRNRGRHR